MDRRTQDSLGVTSVTIYKKLQWSSGRQTSKEDGKGTARILIRGKITKRLMQMTKKVRMTENF